MAADAAARCQYAKATFRRRRPGRVRHRLGHAHLDLGGRPRAVFSDYGNFTNEGSTWTNTGTIKKTAIAGIDRSLFAVGTRNSDDTFTLRVFDASSGSPTKLSTYDSVGDSAVAKVADLAIARVPVNNSGNTSSTADSTTDTKIIKLVVTAATTSGDLQISVFDVDKSTRAITRQTTGGCCVAATKVAVAVPGRPQGMFVTGTLDGSGRVFAVNWQINDSGQLIERSIVQVPASGNYTDVTAAAAGYRRAAIYASNSLSATLATFDITGQWDLSTMAMRSSFSDSNPIQGAKLVSGGSSRLFLVGRRGTAQVVRSYLATTTIQDLDEETDTSFGASTGTFSAAVLENSRLVTAGITGNTIRLTSWRDYHVPVARGFWPTSGTRTPVSAPPPPGDNQTTFGFDTGLGSSDSSIAASDKYVVTCSYDRCKFLDKAGSSLSTKYTGAGEYVSGAVVPLSWESGAGPGLFDSAVGQPGVASVRCPRRACCATSRFSTPATPSCRSARGTSARRSRTTAASRTTSSCSGSSSSPSSVRERLRRSERTLPGDRRLEDHATRATASTCTSAWSWAAATCRASRRRTGWPS